MVCLRLRSLIAGLLAGAMLPPAAAAARPAKPATKQVVRIVLGARDVVYLQQEGYYVSMATSRAGLAKAKRFSRRHAPGDEPLHLTLPKSGPWSRAVLEVCGCAGPAHLYPEVEMRDRAGKAWRYELLPLGDAAKNVGGVKQVTMPDPGALRVAIEAQPESHTEGAARIGLAVIAGLGEWGFYQITAPRGTSETCRVVLTSESGRAVFARSGNLDDFAFG